MPTYQNPEISGRLAELNTEAEQLKHELRNAIIHIVFKHGTTLMQKQQKTVYEDDYGNKFFDKFYVELEYFINHVIYRDLPDTVWKAIFNQDNNIQPELVMGILNKFESMVISDGKLNDDSETSNIISNYLDTLSCRPINEIVQQAELLIAEREFLITTGTKVLIDKESIDDPLLDQAIEIVKANETSSISLVQRSLRISYTRAARLMENMESIGLLSAMDSTGQRKVLNLVPLNVRSTDTAHNGSLPDTNQCRLLVEDGWRKFLNFAAEGSPELGKQCILRFEQQTADSAAAMQPRDAEVFLDAIQKERDKIFDEYTQNPEQLKTRLGVKSHSSKNLNSHPGSIGKTVINTAVRATIWQSVRSLFRYLK